jgi:4-azaleucine resistance transporter AzlC
MLAEDTGNDLTRQGLIAGVRAGIPFAVAGGLLAASFGVVAQDAGLSQLAAILMSAIVFAGSAQFAAIAILSQGGAVGAAIVAAALMNSRFLAMGIALAPSVRGRALWRAIQGQGVVDVSWALAARPDGTFDRGLLFGATGVQYVTWVSGTILGALGGGLLDDPEKFGLDAIYPAFFGALLIGELRGGRTRGVAAAGAAIALALVPFTPAGVPILAASAAALWGLTRRAREQTAAAIREASA